MKWIYRAVWTLWILRGIWFSSCFPDEDVDHDETCFNNCNCCKNNNCHTGDFGWTNACTHGCIDGHRGARCYEICTYNNCRSCDNNKNICDKCYEGFYLGPNNDCTSECPPACLECTSNTRCVSCKDGYYDKDGSTTCQYHICPENCECNDSVCVTCKKGFFDTASLCSRECPPNCVACSSKNLCDECKNNFYNGYELDNSAGPLFNNCSLKCKDTCTKCHSYDNCLHCVGGKFGQKCQHNCSIGCNDRTCNIRSGGCICSSNFAGHKCNECINGKSGTNCNRACPENCKNGKCYKNSGKCSDGCITKTLFGETCNFCIAGMYGTLCNKTCPANCKGNKCGRSTGVCTEGCENKFTGEFCDQCIPGLYGETCENYCSDDCANSICEKETGNCLRCTGNFDGNMCNICKNGFYGLNCISSCSFQCFNKSCAINSGICNLGYTKKFSGDKCCVQSDNCIECASDTECKKCKSGYFSKLCQKKCPVNCLGSCDILSGVCSDCIINHFGPSCNLKCSENCNASRSSATHNCATSDGACMFGCKQGFFGLNCNETCSSLCIDTLCRQESGICSRGCIGTNDDPICLLRLGKPQDVSDDKSTTTTIIILATLFATTSVVLCILIVHKMIKKIHSTIRQTEESVVRSPIQNSQNEEVIVVTEVDNTTYENLNRTRCALEDAYDKVSLGVQESAFNSEDT